MRYMLFTLTSTLILLTMLPASYILAHEGPHVTVQPGETLSEIALRNGADVATLRSLNNLNNADEIHSGRLLALPVGDVEDTASVSAYQPNATSRAVTSRIVEYEAFKEVPTHVVQHGDTLAKIAQQHGNNLAQLLEINQISPAQQLYEGQTLRLPSNPQNQPVDQRREHIVKAGEHLGTIAIKYGLSTDALARYNGLVNPSLITPGQRLLIGETATSAFGTQASLQPLAPFIGEPPTLEKWIDVDLGEQTVVAYQGVMPVKKFTISSGLPNTPTVTGEFRIWAKTPMQDMYGGNRAAGDYYYLEDVQWVQYFFEDYAFHGTYWHNNFGQPMSRGCVNMRNEDAKWLFEWASPPNATSGWFLSDAGNPGTLVVVHD